MNHPFDSLVQDFTTDHDIEAEEILELLPTSCTNTINKRGMSAIHVATAEGKEDMVSLLLQHGADVNAVDNIGNTPLHYCGHKEIATTLLEWGADPLIRYFNVCTTYLMYHEFYMLVFDRMDMDMTGDLCGRIVSLTAPYS